ncbi:MAG: 4Fe-4S dicluster domain-containing protein [Planctomycetes bacterium]|nr:4Fe-4S dicluster domain-containing protein [Planctomycetota bacterium]
MPKVVINTKYCKGCGLCVAFCPKGVLAMSASISPRGINPAEVVDEKACIGCLNCTMVCPDAAIEIFEVEAARKQ